MRYTAYVQTAKIGSRVQRSFEVDDSLLEGMSEPDQSRLIAEHAHDVVFDGGMFEWGWEEE